MNFQYYPAQGNKLYSIVILHGLFGSSKNWISISKFLSNQADVYALDLRNHGDSPHSPAHDLHDMVLDLAEFIRSESIQDPVLLGHSMGGLVVMYYSLLQEQENLPSISRIIIQDIAPRSYPFVYEKEVAAMSLDISKCRSRSEIDDLMSELVPDTFIRQFLQMSLERREDGSYRWKLNVDGISHSRKMFGDVFTKLSSIGLPSLFILGELSPYIKSSDQDLIRSLFPNSEIEVLEGAGHYLQHTHAEKFLSIISNWLGFHRSP